jgi:hypothetical protein
MQGYAYILTHPGTPSVFFDHVFSSYEHEIRRLISLRRQNMIHCRSTVSAFYTFGNKICLLCCTRLSNHILKKLKTFQCLYLYFLKEKNNLPEYLLYLGKRVVLKLGNIDMAPCYFDYFFIWQTKFF